MVTSRSSSKPSGSPVVSPNELNVPAQIDNSSIGKPDTVETVALDQAEQKQEEQERPHNPQGPPELPFFLKLTDIELKAKYMELNRLENERLDAGKGRTSGEWARPEPNPILDRYSNIHPWVNNRVKLHVPEGVNDYINASPVTLVPTFSKQSILKAGIQDKYICMQGPKKETLDHVWHMIWHNLAEPFNSSPVVIIMLSPTHGPMPNDLTKTYEKCFPYYPVDENSPPLVINSTHELGDDFKATVKFISREEGVPGTTVEVRRFDMIVEGEEDNPKPIYHYLYPSWADFGALEEENVAAILAIMESSRRRNGKGENARIVHCSAGVGRTGTFIALEFLMGELQDGAWEEWAESDNTSIDPIFETVNQLRMQRKTMVQAYEQYAFLYEVLRKIWKEKYNVPGAGAGAGGAGGEHKHVRSPAEREKMDVCGTRD